MKNKNDRLVIAYFPNFEAAEKAADSLKDWDKANDAIKLGAIGVLTWDEDFNKLAVKEVGQRDAKKGALWGATIGAAAGILTAGIALIPGLLLGTAAGGGLGALNHKSLGMSNADRDMLESNLRSGGAALAVMADDFEVSDTEAKMAQLGGRTTSYTLPEETTDVLDIAMEAQEEIDLVMADRAIEVKEEAMSMMVAAPALGAETVAKLQQTEVADLETLREKAMTVEGRSELAAATGMTREAVDSLAYDLDLSRVRGLGRKSAKLLHAAGIESVGEIAEWEPEELAARLSAVNADAQITDRLPSAETLATWIDQARNLPAYMRAIKVEKDMLNVDAYHWQAIKGDDPTKTKVDAILFNRKEGYEVKLMIQKICNVFGFQTVEDVKRVEAAIANDLPGNVRSQKNVHAWLVSHFEMN